MGQGSRVILADDDPIMRALAEAKLREAGYAVQAVEDGVEALAALRRDGADLVISDINMPGMDGFALTEAIRGADGDMRQTPVIVITASDEGAAVDRAFAAGATSFMAKPINWSLFNHAVKFVLRASEDEKALREARDQAEAGAKFKDSLMSVMSHELRTPLNAIIGFGQLIGGHFETQSDALYKEYADYIVEGGKRLLDSISDMLLASEARSGVIAITEADAAVGDVIAEALAQKEKLVADAGGEIQLRLQDPDLEVRCDRALLARAIGKLVDNAVKFSPRGVRIVIGSALTPKGGLALLVKDNGPGIAPEKLAEITAPFSQSDMSTRRSREGLGLGVPLVQAIARAHDAAFKLVSAEPEGARALIVLPAARIRASAGDRIKHIA